MTKKLTLLFLILTLPGFDLLAQDIDELQNEINSYEIINAELSDSLTSIEAKIDSLQEMIDQLAFEDLLEGGKEIYLKPNSLIYEGDHVTRPVIAKLPEGGTAIFIEPVNANYTKVNYQGTEGFVPNWSIEEKSEALLRAETKRLESQRKAEEE
ncbi:MAG: DUF3450 domain-containing protein [Gracilimonas sp.]|uniref:hypothetical protein n=1 Tax=Gracilimonas sp. TaxID=1974203 RepID=UPI003751593C|nr:DUF3450 domain-containing protein [Gracilimonas sp.]